VKKILYIILDGLGDLPCPELDGKTPLEASITPFMDDLAKRGQTGLMYPVGEGIAPESDVAVISILGYEAEKYYTGRGPLECYAAGLRVNDGDLAYRVNFATLGEHNKIIDRRVGRSLTTEEATKLAESINTKVKLDAAAFVFKNTVGHRGVLVIHSLQGKLSSEVTNTDPAYAKEGPFGVAKTEFEDVLQECKPVEGFEGSPEAQRAVSLTNEFIRKSHQVLERDPVNKRRVNRDKLPANVILTRDGGNRLPKFPTFGEQYGLGFGCFVEMPVERGIALLTGMEVIELPQATDEPSFDYQLRARKALESIEDFEGLYIHIKGPDEPAHDGKALKKKESIELIDRFFFANLLPEINLERTIVAVTADHSTPCTVKAHSNDPVPLLIAGGKIVPDDTSSFSEVNCKRGALGRIYGPKLMPLLIKYAD